MISASIKEKYYVMNKPEDYERGFGCGVQVETRNGETGLWNQEGGSGYSAYVSRVFDGLEEETVWHRMVFRNLSDSFVTWRFTFYASDEKVVLDEDGISMEEKKEAYEPYRKMAATGVEDMLLHEVQGRYLWFLAEVYCTGSQRAGFGDVRIYFPKQTWVSYLPQVYDRGSEDTFLDRYLGIFQSLYDDLNQRIEEIPYLMDPEAAGEEALRWLAGWLGIQDTGIWNYEQLQYLVSHGASLYRKRGTREGIRQFIRLYTGEDPLIVEQHLMEQYAEDEKQYVLLKKLYGSSPYTFYVLIRAECIPTGKELADIQRIIKDVKPAWMECKVITLRPYLLLDQYSYLGINSVLGQYRSMELDGTSMISFSKVGEGKQE